MNSKGFTLVEMLCTIVILLLISALVVTGVELGVKSYHRSISDSEAQVLCSTLTTAVSDELRYSGTVHLKEAGLDDYDMTQFTIFSKRFGDEASFSVNTDGQILLSGKKLIPSKAYAYGARADLSIRYSPAGQYFTVTISIYNRDRTRELTSNTFEVKLLNKGA